MMQNLNLKNPFQAPVYFTEHCDSTQTAARELLRESPVTGTVVTAAYQDKGRGRGINRLWTARPGENLLFTIIFHYEHMGAVPGGFTLRTGLAVAEAIAEFVPALDASITVKWPNDVMIGSRKVCGILAENDGRYILTGIGVNLNQLEFPSDIRRKAISIRQALQEIDDIEPPVLDSRILLEHILPRLKTYLADQMNAQWKSMQEKRLYKKGEPVSFIPGQAGSAAKVEGILEGIGPEGELLIRTGAGIERFITGELEYQYCS